MTTIDLSRTHRADYHPKRGYIVRAIWLCTEALVFANPVVTSYRFKATLLRMFGARVGHGVVIKPGVKVKYPWRLSIGHHSWLGERCWIDNMENVEIGENVVVSQDAYLCTGNHDWSDPVMPLRPRPIVVGAGAWIGARACVAPGVNIAPETVVALGAVVLRDTLARGIYTGNPATYVRDRQLNLPAAPSAG